MLDMCLVFTALSLQTLPQTWAYHGFFNQFNYHSMNFLLFNNQLFLLLNYNP
ncbi:hypothetical protein ArsFIN_07490 [Arsenophonus nasoniae]|uniref:Uncharacterized protein n=1 Tax=Arsenophonus nasoniae TaxID=638 RepID=D2U348_9GAMM|nr:hypothetical protein ArsFIN_07490 [Arsenophonus nasoniae]CBA75650.1 hypothetical protein ARN_30450 [Arsenophonus nasoniae]